MEFEGFHSLVCLVPEGKTKVYTAFQESLKRQVVLKITSQPLNAAALKLSQLHHPGLIHIYDTFNHEENYVVVEEWVPGVSLKKMGALPMPVAVGIFYKLSQALWEMHQRNLLHGDLHPDNIMLRTDLEPKLLDMEFSVEVGELPKGGTAGFQNPEVVSGLKLLPKSDIFSFGACFYFALTGESPFTGSWEESAAKVMRRKVDLVPIHESVRLLVERCFSEENPFEDTEELMEELEILWDRVREFNPSHEENRLAHLWKEFWSSSLKKSYEESFGQKNYIEAGHLLKIRQAEGETLFREWRELSAKLNERPKRWPLRLVLVVFFLGLLLYFLLPKETAQNFQRVVEKDLAAMKQSAEIKETGKRSHQTVNKIWVPVPQNLLENSIYVNQKRMIIKEEGIFLPLGDHSIEVKNTTGESVYKGKIQITKEKVVWREIQ